MFYGACFHYILYTFSVSLRYPLAVDHKKQMRPSGWQKSILPLGQQLNVLRVLVRIRNVNCVCVWVKGQMQKETANHTLSTHAS